MVEPIYLPRVLFVSAEYEALCRQHLASQTIVTLRGVEPSGKPARCNGVVRSLKPRSVLQPGFPLMITMLETFPGDDVNRDGP